MQRPVPILFLIAVAIFPARASLQPAEPVPHTTIDEGQMPGPLTGAERVYTRRCVTGICSVGVLRAVRPVLGGDMYEVDAATRTWEVKPDHSRGQVKEDFSNDLTVTCEEPAVWKGDTKTEMTLTAESGFQPADSDVPLFDLWWAVCRNITMKYSGD